MHPYCNLNIIDRKDGNNWNSGPAPPPPPGTTPSPKGRSSRGNDSPSGSGSKKTGIGGGGIAGIIISIFVVGGIVAFFLVKRRSKRSSLDLEMHDNQPFVSLSSTNDMQGSPFLLALFFLLSIMDESFISPLALHWYSKSYSTSIDRSILPFCTTAYCSLLYRLEVRRMALQFIH